MYLSRLVLACCLLLVVGNVYADTTYQYVSGIWSYSPINFEIIYWDGSHFVTTRRAATMAAYKRRVWSEM